MFASFHRHDGVNGYSILRRDGHLAVAGDACIVKVKEEGNAGVTHSFTQGGRGGSDAHKQHNSRRTTNLGCAFVFGSSHKS